MCSGYTSTPLALRANGPYSAYNHFYFLGDRTGESSDNCSLLECCPSSRAAFSIRGIPINPRFLYGYCLRQSNLIQWSPSRRFISDGSRYCRLTLRSRDRGLLRERGRRRQYYCGASCRVSESDGTFQEMLGLLAEVEACCRERGCICRDANELSEKKEDCGRLIHSGSRGEVTSRDNVHGIRKNGSSSSYHLGSSSSSSGGFGSSGVRHRRVMEEFSCEHGKNDDFAKTNVQVLQNYKNNARLKGRSFGSESNAHSDSRRELGKKDLSYRKVPELRSKDSMDKTALSKGCAYRGREEFVWEDCVVGKRESREQPQKPNRTSEVHDSSTERDSIYKKLYSVKMENGEDTSISDVNLVKELQRQQNEIDRLRQNCQELLRTSELCVSNAKGGSSSSKVYREDSSMTYAKLVEELRRQRCELDLLTKNYEQLTRISVIRESDNDGASISNNVYNTKLDDRSTSVVHSVDKAREKNSDIDQRVSGGSDLRRNSQKAMKISGIHNSDTENTSRSQRHLEIKLKESENSLASIQVAREKIAQTDQQVAEKMDRSKLSQNFTTFSETRSATEKTSSSQRLLEARMDEQDENSTYAVHLVPAAREQKNEFDEHVPQPLGFRKESQRDEWTDDVTGEKVSNMRIENREENFSLVLIQQAKENRKAYMSGEKGSSARESVPEAFRETVEKCSSSAEKHINELDEQTTNYENYQGTEGTLESARRLEMSSSQYVGEFVDKLHQGISSSNKLDIASDGSSETQREKVSGGTSQTATVQQQKVLSPTSTFQNTKHIHESPRQSSSTCEIKVLADEIWDVACPSSHETIHAEEPEKFSSEEGVAGPTSDPTSTETVIVKRSGRSFWNYIADVVRKSWSPRSESHKSTLKPGTRSQSNESVGSETWFSGHEPDDDDNEIVTRGRNGAPKESTPIKRPVDHPEMRTSPATSQETREARKEEDITMQVEAEGSTGITTRRYASRSSSPVSGTANSGWLVGEKGRQSGATVVTSVISSTSVPSSSSMRTSPATSHKTREARTYEDITMQVEADGSTGTTTRRYASRGSSPVSRTENSGWLVGEKGRQSGATVVTSVISSTSVACSSSATNEGEKTEIGKVQMPEIGLKKSEEEPNRDKLAEIGGTVGKDTELKQRKFQRNKQVLKEQFDEWEEAYKVESEQRKFDEFFMREALLEAKKAADLWEVPVGAVLVQNGKIIARGCNLVEDLRDSTAHAEMICIREASNVLRTWRLVETTLYVTLEPCAMCAGAILQARIDTVVWGAPNRLLGADGSWVRLFPAGDEGRSSSDKSNQMPGPIHPFHPKIAIRRGILGTECSDAMQQFFKLRRKKNKQPEPPSPSRLPILNHPTKLLTKMHDTFSMMFCL